MYSEVKKLLTEQAYSNGYSFYIKVLSSDSDNSYDDDGIPISKAPIITLSGTQIELSTLSDYKGESFDSVAELVEELNSIAPIVKYNNIIIPDLKALDIAPPLEFTIKGFHKYDKTYLNREGVPFTNDELIEIVIPFTPITKKICKNDIVKTKYDTYRVNKEYNIGDVWRGLQIQRER